MKVKNRADWWYELKREAAMKRRRVARSHLVA